MLPVLYLLPSALVLPTAPLHACPSAACATGRLDAPTMLFGGGGDKEAGAAGGGMGNMMETIKKAQQVGVKVKELQEELQQTEIEAIAADGGVTVTVTGAQVPVSVVVTDELVAKGAAAVSEAVGLAHREAHKNSVEYTKERMTELYKEIGLPMPGAEGSPM